MIKWVFFDLGWTLVDETGAHRLAAFGIRDAFSIILASAELGISKPDLRIFQMAVSQAECHADEAIIVGDRLDNDIGPAKLQGWRTLRVLQGFARFQRPRTEHEIPDATIERISELPATLRGMDKAANSWL